MKENICWTIQLAVWSGQALSAGKLESSVHNIYQTDHVLPQLLFIVLYYKVSMMYD